MNYPLENLGAHRFQALCQALLVRSFPDIQCFPVSQPDGGRDAVLASETGSGQELVVFQVKYTEHALREKQPHKSVVDNLREELTEIASRIRPAATKYILITNVRGTATASTGSIDIVQHLLEKHLSIPAMCWWRDDIERRLDDAWEIKFSFPEVLRTFDILQMMIERDSSENKRRCTIALRAFVRDQFEYDADVRFKQVDLQTRLLDLFVDVPINLPRNDHRIRGLRKEYRALFEIARQSQSRSQQQPQLGAATALLHPIAQDHLTRVVIEGAPGQGKSTIVQYICQVHRDRLLGRSDANSATSQGHPRVPIRLPFKVECRDLAVWLRGKNPFVMDDAKSDLEPRFRTLESFLSMQIESSSGGATFGVSDLHAVVVMFAVLLVFDGLDEVADIGERGNVVDEISRGIKRIQELAMSLQTIVTSRPTTFTNSPSFPKGSFVYLQLGSIDNETIKSYARKWVEARQLDERDARDVEGTLDARLDQPHLRDLARNPMQLTILLSLIHRKGISLPDKRTALYDHYIDLFFDRESEKSQVVRESRELLVSIHGHLAWILHSEAQTKGTGGRIDAKRLRDVVERYLVDHGHKTELLGRLFSGVVERVVAIVSRIEGSYEFEVQPMREYFAARYLYDTAPYSPAGSVRSGTLPERFEALAADSFWQNVTRFYAGCYNQGELPSLLSSLRALSGKNAFRNSCYLQSLAASLLSDYTFAQYPLIVNEAVDFVMREVSLRLLLSSERDPTRTESLYLPKSSGNTRLLYECFGELRNCRESEYARFLIETIMTNSDLDERGDLWWDGLSRIDDPKNKTQWMSYGLGLGVMQVADRWKVESLLADVQSEYEDRVFHLSFGGMADYISQDAKHLCSLVNTVLDRDNELVLYPKQNILLDFVMALSSQRYSIVFRERSNESLSRIWDRHGFFDELPSEDTSVDRSYDVLNRCHVFVGTSNALAGSIPAETWASELTPWEQLTERGRELFGERWAFRILASIAAGILSTGEQCSEASDLFDLDVPVVRRARNGRLRAGQWTWWQVHLRRAIEQQDIAFVLLMLLRWSGRTVVVRMKEEIEEKLDQLSKEWWRKLFLALGNVGRWSERKRLICADGRELGREMSERLAAAVWGRSSERARRWLFRTHLEAYRGADQTLLEFCQEVALEATLGSRRRCGWREWLPGIVERHEMGVGSLGMWPSWRYWSRPDAFPVDVASEVVEESHKYPIALLGWAEKVCREEGVVRKVVPVGKVAETNGWFSR